MKIEVVTLFPAFFDSVMDQSITARGQAREFFEIKIIDLRDYTVGRHKTADDKPFGGGGGMVLKIDPLDRCLKDLGYGFPTGPKERIVLTSAAGRILTQSLAVEYSLLRRLTIICGHYLGVDERLLSLYEVDEIAIGDYVLTGGEPAAAVVLDAVTRLIPGVLGNFESALTDSHVETILGAPVYTRPEEYRGLRVPEELISGNHKEIERFRRFEALKKTYRNRPELLERLDLDDTERAYITSLKNNDNENK
ncbi:MAG: tRNA (guanosine(37)-N1)-methyltransferase TrmD [Candidatus Zixiibacteriota bacterium]|nr:MAG: tRNA (guanosine(37)-N1)-methyltransferase TrmD [candidate division Zixibacteria bacterium]